MNLNVIDCYLHAQKIWDSTKFVSQTSIHFYTAFVHSFSIRIYVSSRLYWYYSYESIY